MRMIFAAQHRVRFGRAAQEKQKFFNNHIAYDPLVVHSLCSGSGLAFGSIEDCRD